tara:strand:- start:246 stop:761 length:516 start_codon:yes stop_codon:yes gene_type:complete
MKIIYVSLIGLFLLAFVACGNTEPTDVPKFTSGEATALVYNSQFELMDRQLEILYLINNEYNSFVASSFRDNRLKPLSKERIDSDSPFGYVDEVYLGNGKWAVTVFSNGFRRINSTPDTNWEEIYNNYDGILNIFIVYEESLTVSYKGNCGKESDPDREINPCNDLQKTFK